MWAIATIALGALIVVALRQLAAYETTSGEARAAPARWPAASTLPRATAGFTLVMFVHPGCPCSRASLHELQVLAAGAAARPRIVVVFADAEPGPYWELAGRVTGATRIADASGAEARRFGALTSGHVVVYDAAGALRFAGGITGSRGHVGDNLGRRGIEAALRGAPGIRDREVFGCALGEGRS